MSIHHFIIALGSNTMQEENIALAKDRLLTLLGDDLMFSDDLRTMPIGIDSDVFINGICTGSTHMSLEELTAALKDIERSMGRKKGNEVTIDLDVLQYDNEKLRPGDWERDYVGQLLFEMEDQ